MRKSLKETLARFNDNGGRGVWDAEEIDTLRQQIKEEVNRRRREKRKNQ